MGGTKFPEGLHSGLAFFLGAALLRLDETLLGFLHFRSQFFGCRLVFLESGVADQAGAFGSGGSPRVPMRFS